MRKVVTREPNQIQCEVEEQLEAERQFYQALTPDEVQEEEEERQIIYDMLDLVEDELEDERWLDDERERLESDDLVNWWEDIDDDPDLRDEDAYGQLEDKCARTV